jgi:hypothetical protein
MCCRIRVFLIIIIIFLSLQKLGPPNYSYGPWWTKTLIYIYIYIYFLAIGGGRTTPVALGGGRTTPVVLLVVVWPPPTAKTLTIFFLFSFWL